MVCKGIFTFKTLTHRSGGSFKNNMGQDVSYPSAYILKVDELLDNGDINERKFKIAEEKKSLINSIKGFKPYDKILITFDVTLFDTRVTLEVCKVELNSLENSSEDTNTDDDYIDDVDDDIGF